MNKDLKDHGPKPFVVDVEKLTIDNKNYRTVIWTGKYMQMSVMSIPPGEDIGLEIHKDHDQFLRIEKGEGIVQMGDAEDNLDFQEKVGDDFAILIPAGKWHNLVNTNTEPLKLYSIYSPVEHPKNTVHKTRQAESTKHYNGGKLSNHTNINMKFNKEKTKKFASGGKTPQEIMAEARRNQQIEQEAQRRDIELNVGAAERIAPSNVVPQLSNVGLRQNPSSVAMNPTNIENVSFSQAFAQAKREGLKEFIWRGRRFTTEVGTSEEQPTTKVESQTEQKTETPVANTRVDSLVTPPVEQNDSVYFGVHLSELPEWVVGPRSNKTAPRRETVTTSLDAESNNLKSNWWQRFDERNRVRRQEALNRQGEVPKALQKVGAVANKLSMRYQQGGQIPKYNDGGFLNRIKENLSKRFQDPNRHQVGDSYTTYKEKTPFIGVPKELRYITGPNRQTSTMIISRPNTSRADTTFYSPGYSKNPDLYPPFKPSDIRAGNKKGLGNESFLQKFTSPEYFPHLKKYQQGGVVDSDNQEQLILDFAIRYLKGLGVNEETLSSGIPDEFMEDVTTAINEVNNAEFWAAYEEDPETTMQDYLASREDMTYDSIEFAKKGAKLKKLKSRQKRCKCGCKMESHKEGGKLVTKCSCGCDTK